MKHLHQLLLVFGVLLSLPAFSLSIQLTAKDAACGNNNGSITVQVTGAPPFNYQWSSGQMTQNIDNLAPGTYTIIVTDNGGATDSATAIIGNTTEITGGCLSYVTPLGGISHPCNNLCNGIAYLSVDYMNGTPPYSIGTTLSHPIGSFGPTFIPTVEGICSDDVYTVFVSDALGCTGTACPTFSYPNTSFGYTAQITAACNGISNGQVLLTFNDMQGIPVSGVWTGPTPGSVSNMFSNIDMTSLLPGTYTLTVTNDYAVTPCDTNITVIIPNLGLNCGIVSGLVYLDTIPNCLPDVTEPAIPGRMIRFTPGPYYATTDNAGNYVASLPYGTYTAETVTNFYFTGICNVPGVNLTALNTPLTGIYLGDSTSLDLDLSMHLSSSAARPGFGYSIYATIINHTFVPATNPEAVVNYDPVLTLLGSNLPYAVTGPSQITVQFPSIASFGSEFAHLTFLIPPNPLLIGTIITHNATLNANQPELNLANNTDIWQQMITGSYDPNEKVVWPAWDLQHTYLVDVDSLFRYTIRFQNSGNDTAFNVVLVDTLNEFLDVTSLQMLGSSHACHWEITGPNILKVYYDNILLPDSTTNEPASHGLFSFALTHTPALEQQIFPYLLENTASIYFDFNPPVITNTEFNTIDISVGLEELEKNEIMIRPNPANENVYVTCNGPDKIEQIVISDMMGRLVKKTKAETKSTLIHIEELPAGLYIIAAEGIDFKFTEKLIIY